MMLAPEQGGGGQDPYQIVQDLSAELMSPYCPARTIEACPSSAARKLEDEILIKAKAGETREEIEAELVRQFGPEIIGYRAPPALLWGTLLVGIVALVLIATFARRWLRRSRGRGAHVSGGAAPAGGPSRIELDALDDALDEDDRF